MAELDPWLSRAQAQDATLVRLETLLMAVTESALAETLAEMWIHVLGERVVLVAATEPPQLGGLGERARVAWTSALVRWVKPVVLWGYSQQYPDAPERAREAWWVDVSSRLGGSVDGIVNAITETARVFRAEPVDQLRDRLARILQLDANPIGVQQAIAETESKLLNATLSAVDKSALWSRRVRLLSSVFRLQASRSRSSGFRALASVAKPEQVPQLRDLARQSSRPVSAVTDAEREVQTLDFRLYRNPEADPAETVRLTSRRRELAEDGSETWRETSRRMSRTEATGLLNGALWQRFTDESQRDGTELVHRWVATTTDDRTRPDHLAANGQVVALDQPFTVGDAKLMFPGDPSGPPAETVNCRCSQVILTRAEHDELASTLTADAGGPMTEIALEDLPPVMWHGVVAREDVFTGDRRKFNAGAIRTQALPMPIRFQREDWGGHTGAVVIANMEEARRFDGAVRAWGTFADPSTTPEVAEVISLMANQMMRGVSIDGDDVLDSQFSVELDAEGNVFEIFDSMRLRSATFVAIPAFDGAEVFLGPPPMDWLLEGEPVRVEQNEPGPTVPIDMDTMLAAVSTMPEQLQDFWITGEGAAKIRWGTPGDFARCVRQLNDFVPPGQAEGACANLHHRALGKWPGESNSAQDVLVASVTGSTNLPVADRGHVWNGAASKRRVLEMCGDDVSCISRAFLWRDPDANPETQAAWSLGFADVIDGELRIIPAGVAAAAGGHGVDALKGVSTADKDRIKSRICSLYNVIRKKFDDWPECPFTSLVASLEGMSFKAEDFAERDLGGVVPITITDDGRIFGYAADRITCHVGFSDVCITAPFSKTNYGLFHLGAIKLDDGSELRVGKVTVGGGHANARFGVRAATEHYDDSSTAVAVVRAYDKPDGIAVFGRLIPGVDPAKVEELRRSPLSGDWREYKGNLEMVAALGVNNPGFPVMATSEGRQVSLVAAGVVQPDLSQQFAELDARMAPIIDPEIRVAELDARMMSGGQ